MLNRIVADTLDLSRLPSPTLVEVDFEAVMVARRADLLARMEAAGIPYDVDMLETDPAIILQEADAYREIIARQAINDAGLANMVAFSAGADLENLAANYGLERQVVVPATDALPATMETDDRLRRRIQLAPEAYAAAGSAGGYIFHALTAVPTLADAYASNPAPGVVVVALIGSKANPAPTADEVQAARDHLNREDIKPITDMLSVQPATIIPVALSANLVLYPGPDPAAVIDDARANLDRFLALNKRIGRDLRQKAWVSRLLRDTVQNVTAALPTGDIIAGPTDCVWVTGVTLTAVGVDE